jgi:hypothetical protein
METGAIIDPDRYACDALASFGASSELGVTIMSAEPDSDGTMNAVRISEAATQAVVCEIRAVRAEET